MIYYNTVGGKKKTLRSSRLTVSKNLVLDKSVRL